MRADRGLNDPHATSQIFYRSCGGGKSYVDKLAEKAEGAASSECAVSACHQTGEKAFAARLHSAWNQTSVRTGRLSCARPNLQQVSQWADATVPSLKDTRS